MRKLLYVTSLVVVVVAAVNWGLWGLFEFDPIAALAGSSTALVSRGIYILFGLAGVVLAATSYRRAPRKSSPRRADDHLELVRRQLLAANPRFE